MNELDELAKLIRKRVRKDWDLCVAITGEEGSGKSTLGIELARLIDPHFTIEKNEMISPNADEMTEKITQLPKYSCIIADEAIRILYKLRWYSKAQIYLNQLFAISRKENKVVILCLPRFTDLNEYFRNHRVKIWLHVLARGTAVMFSKDWSPFNRDPWQLDSNQSVMEKYSIRKSFAEMGLDRKTKVLTKLKNYVSIVPFNDLDKTTKAEYTAMKDKHTYDELEKAMEEDMSQREIRLRTAVGLLSKAFQSLGTRPKYVEGLTGYSRVHINTLIQAANKYLEDNNARKEAFESLLNKTVESNKR